METAVETVRPVADDAALLERHRGGDPTAFDEIVTRHRRVVYLVARRMLGSHESADEAAQEAFVRAWRSVDRFRGDCALRSWLIGIVINVSRTLGATARPAEALSDDGTLVDRGERSDERWEREQMRGRVRRAVAALPPRQRAVVALKVFSELSYREVAEAMSLSEGTVKAHLHQAVGNLRRLMARQEEEEAR